MYRITAILIFSIFFLRLVAQSDRIKFDNLLTQTEIDMLSENYDDALVSADSALLLKPASSTVYFLKAKIYANQKSFYLALNNIEKAVELNDTNVFYYHLLFEIYRKINDYDKAGYAVEKIIELTDSFDDYLYFANYYDSLARYDKSVEILEKAVETFGHSEYVDLPLFFDLTKTDPQKAKNFALQIYNLYPDNIYIINSLSDYYVKNSLTDSLKIFLSEIKTKSSNPQIADLFYSLIYANKFLQNLDSAYLDSAVTIFAKCYDKVLPDYIFYFIKKYDFFYNPYYLNEVYDSVVAYLTQDYYQDRLNYIAGVYGSFFRYCNQIEILEKLLSQPPYKLQDANRLMALYLRFSMWDKLDSLAGFYTALYPANPAPMLYKGIASLNKGNNEDALYYLQSGKSMIYDDTLMTAYFDFFTAIYYYKNNDLDNYNFFIDETTSLTESDCKINQFFATYLCETGMLNDLVFELIGDCIMQSTETLPHSLAYVYSYALYNKNDFETALKYINIAIENSPYPNFIYYYRKYLILRQLNNRDAEKFYKLSVKYGNKCKK